MKRSLCVLLLITAGLAQAGPGEGASWVRTLTLVPQLQGAPGHMPPPGGRERGEERRRLREDVREGRLPRDEAVRQYREQFPDRQHHERRRMSQDERDQMRRDIHEANRNLRKR